MSVRDDWHNENDFCWDQVSIEKKLEASRDNSVVLLRNVYNSIDVEVEACITRKVRREVFKQRISNHCIESSKDYGIIFDVSSVLMKFNAGGKGITVKREKMLPKTREFNLLYSVICGRWSHRLPVDKHNCVFLNINPAWIEPIIDYLRIGSPSVSMKSIRSRLSESDAIGFDAVVSHFNQLGVIAAANAQNKADKAIDTEVSEASFDFTSTTSNDVIGCSLRVLSSQIPSKILALQNAVALDTDSFLRLILRVAENLQREEESLLLELLWIAHFSTASKECHPVGRIGKRVAVGLVRNLSLVNFP